jgi:hypothetical protein
MASPTIPTITEPAALEPVARVRLTVTITRPDGRHAALGILLTPEGAVIDHPAAGLSAIVTGDVLATLPAWLRRELDYAALTIA